MQKIGIDLFSGGGGVKTGWVDAGICPALGIELDPCDRPLSYQMSTVQSFNLAKYGSKVVNETVQQMAAKRFPGVPRSPYVLHMSPVCASFSAANIGGRETKTDIEIGESCAIAVEEIDATYITLENVGTRKYLESQQFKIIREALEKAGYDYHFKVVDMADYGVPQNRKRLFLLANKQGAKPLKFPPKQPQKGWAKALDGLTLKPIKLLANQEDAIASYLKYSDPEMVLLSRTTGHGNKVALREGGEPCWTITKSMFRDGKGASRTQSISVWIKGKGSFNLPIRASARICGFPDWYALPEEDIALAGAIIGYAVSPAFVSLLFRSQDVGS